MLTEVVLVLPAYVGLAIVIYKLLVQKATYDNLTLGIDSSFDEVDKTADNQAKLLVVQDALATAHAKAINNHELTVANHGELLLEQHNSLAQLSKQLESHDHDMPEHEHELPVHNHEHWHGPGRGDMIMIRIPEHIHDYNTHNDGNHHWQCGVCGQDGPDVIKLPTQEG